MLVKGCKLPATILTSSGDLMCSIIIIANNTVLYLKFANRVDLKCSHHKKEIVII